jgi:hypothetical protein
VRVRVNNTRRRRCFIYEFVRVQAKTNYTVINNSPIGRRRRRKHRETLTLKRYFAVRVRVRMFRARL